MAEPPGSADDRRGVLSPRREVVVAGGCEELGEHVARWIAESGGVASFTRADVLEKQVEGAGQHTVDRYGSLDREFNAAILESTGELVNRPVEEFDPGGEDQPVRGLPLGSSIRWPQWRPPAVARSSMRTRGPD